MGFIGASLRYALELALPANGGFPFATLLVNIFGCFVLELVNRYIGRRMHLPVPLVKSLGVGLVGAFTTLSAFSTECLSLIHAGKLALAALYVATTLATTLLATFAGHATCRALEARKMKRLEQLRAVRSAGRASSKGSNLNSNASALDDANASRASSAQQQVPANQSNGDKTDHPAKRTGRGR